MLSESFSLLLLPRTKTIYYLRICYNIILRWDLVLEFSGHYCDQVVGVKKVWALCAAVSWWREIKATVDTFVPTHVKGPFEGHAPCDDGLCRKERSEHVDQTLSLPLRLSVSLLISISL